MQKPAPYIDGEGNRFYNLRQAAQVAEGVTASTLLRWASKGITSFGFKLDIKREPLIHEPRGFRHEARTHKETRMLIPEVQVLAMKEIFQEVGRNRPGPWSPAEMDALRVAASRYRRTLQVASQHTPRPPR
jgi:hypothetical protein